MRPRPSFLLPIATLAATLAIACADRPVDPIAASTPPLATSPSPPDIDTRFNQHPLPAGNDDLLAIESAVQQALPVALKALVCIQIDGGSGSGIVVSPNGLILSAAHVVMEPGKQLDVILPGGKKVKAETLGLVPETDAGMARILDEGTYDFAPLGNADDLRLGHWCFALGHSGGWDAARGPVVRIGRIIRLGNGTMQSDCKLIGGDSGGPLFDMYGRLIGINSRVGMNIEESLHCPVSIFIRDDQPLRRGIVVGQDKPAFLGAAFDDLPDGGIRVGKLLKDGPAERGGLKEGDVITTAFGEPVKDKAAFARVLGTVKAGERILVHLRRKDGNEEELWLRTNSKDGFEVMGT